MCTTENKHVYVHKSGTMGLLTFSITYLKRTLHFSFITNITSDPKLNFIYA